MDHQLISCLNCESTTPHTRGPVQSIADGAQILWWTCTVCSCHSLP